jgi:AraC-like DNA-binding protein
MLFERIFAARRSDIVRFSDLDTFRPLEFASGAKSLPLNPKSFSCTYATVRLPACQIVVQHSFPRILDLAYQTDGILLVIPLDDNVRVLANGEELDSGAFLAVSGKAGGKFVEPKDNLFALIHLKPQICGRGWLERPDFLHLLKTHPATMENVREALLAIVEAAVGHGQDEAVAEALQEELLQVLDGLWFASGTRRNEARASLIRYSNIVDHVDAWIAANPTRAIYSAELAATCDVSVRTLGSAVLAIRGVNLHRYLRIKRLWRSRAQLAAAPSGLSVKSCALANGFTHFGEFARAYKTTFGEMASQTLARGRA